MLLTDIILRQDNAAGGGGYIHQQLTSPLASNIHVFVTFVFVVLAILGVLVAFRIYSNWINGDTEDTLEQISKWLLGMVLCIVLITGLKTWLAMNPASDDGVEYNFE